MLEELEVCRRKEIETKKGVCPRKELVCAGGVPKSGTGEGHRASWERLMKFLPPKLTWRRMDSHHRTSFQQFSRSTLLLESTLGK